ncbi:MAG: FAD-binding oxidoreductase, partial [Ghiorsea sp.]|nr:FAD-binding oxidoreductase [Ghiorsea sp.]
MTVQIKFQDKTYACAKDRPILLTMQEQGAVIPSSCQNGFCHVCLSKVVKGKAPESAQQGLSDNLIKQGCFLPCVCKPDQDLTMEVATKDNVMFEKKGISPFDYYTTMVIDKTWLNKDILRLCLVRPEALQYKAGQFINIHQHESPLTRSYSLASMPCENFMELHIKRITSGKMSTWLCDEVQCGDNINISGPSGECYYQTNNPKQDIILAGVGTGLAPLYGILRDAIESEHQGHIFLFHGSIHTQGLYYQEE